MHFSTLTTLAGAIGLAQAKNIAISVGQSGLTFSPNNPTAAMGDMLVFTFFGNHSVVMGDFNNACEPAGSGGFYSGFVANSGDTFTVEVNSTDPMPFYCSQLGGHCQGGMVGVVNPSGSMSVAAFEASAKKTSSSGSPASVFGGTAGTSTSSANPACSSKPSSSSGGSSGSYGGYKFRRAASSTDCTTAPSGSSSSSKSSGAAGLRVGAAMLVGSVGVGIAMML